MQAERRVSCGAHSNTRNVTQLRAPSRWPNLGSKKWPQKKETLKKETLHVLSELLVNSCQPKGHPDCISLCRVSCDHADHLSLGEIVGGVPREERRTLPPEFRPGWECLVTMNTVSPKMGPNWSSLKLCPGERTFCFFCFFENPRALDIMPSPNLNLNLSARTALQSNQTSSGS
jgi:hypothetical protein